MPRNPLALMLLVSFLPLSGQHVEDMGLSLEQLEDKLFQLVNLERRGRGLSELQLDPRLRAMARAHSLKMLREKTLAHDFPGYEKLAGRAVAAGLHFSELGENVASSDTFVMRFYHEQLMASAGHRVNLLGDRFRQLGIGIALSGGQYYVTQEFARLFTPVAAAEMEREMEQRLEARLGRLRMPAAAAAEMRESCRRLATLFLEERSPREIASSLGVGVVHNLSFIDRDDGLRGMLAATKGSRPLYWSLGAAFGRTPRNPGGIYSLSLIVFPDLRDDLRAYGDLNAAMLGIVNNIRVVSRAPRLEGAAKEVARQFYRSPISRPVVERKRFRLTLAYQTTSLAAIPDDVARRIAAAPRIRSVGIHVLYPLVEGLLGNYFIVAILAI
ncbi:MAG: CAP domain-containing protein [Candidatus Aminicenantes bacterium]|nr:CAP domain-containing protein [Candidatus Aminicenantes bacterium]